VYSTCLSCHARFRSNAAIEAFPIGRRLAFDPARGRLWVVCGRCGRWCLAPFDERWEAIEECERRFRSTKLRASTDNIGLARLTEGTDLVRVGTALRPELAVWRYGRRFRRQHSVAVVVHGAQAAVSNTLRVSALAGAFLSGPGLAIRAGIIVAAFGAASYWQHRVVARLHRGGEPPLLVRRRDLGALAVVRGSSASPDWALQVKHHLGTAKLADDDASRAARVLLPALNWAGGDEVQVATAVRRLESGLDPATLFRSVAESRTMPRMGSGVPLVELPASQRLALEMALHEESERRALDGELAALEQAWREAEEIAAIADSLLVPQSIEQQLARLRSRSVRAGAPGDGGDEARSTSPD
jgi:hypothetical protein